MTVISKENFEFYEKPCVCPKALLLRPAGCVFLLLSFALSLSYMLYNRAKDKKENL